jgi:hypothetical protein
VAFGGIYRIENAECGCAEISGFEWWMFMEKS